MYKFWIMYLGVELLGHTLTLCLTVWITAKIFSTKAGLYNPTSNAQGFQFPLLLANTCYFLELPPCFMNPLGYLFNDCIFYHIDLPWFTGWVLISLGILTACISPLQLYRDKYGSLQIFRTKIVLFQVISWKYILPKWDY